MQVCAYLYARFGGVRQDVIAPVARDRGGSTNAQTIAHIGGDVCFGHLGARARRNSQVSIAPAVDRNGSAENSTLR